MHEERVVEKSLIERLSCFFKIKTTEEKEIEMADRTFKMLYDCTYQEYLNYSEKYKTCLVNVLAFIDEIKEIKSRMPYAQTKEGGYSDYPSDRYLIIEKVIGSTTDYCIADKLHLSDTLCERFKLDLEKMDTCGLKVEILSEAEFRCLFEWDTILNFPVYSIVGKSSERGERIAILLTEE